jgi:outer membrane biosynthesis protein TonB
MRQFEKRTTHARRERFNQVFLLIPKKWLHRSLLLHFSVVLFCLAEGMIPDTLFRRPSPPPEEPAVQVDIVGPEDPDLQRALSDSAAQPVGDNIPQVPSQAQSGANDSPMIAAVPPEEPPPAEQPEEDDAAEVPSPKTPAPTRIPTIAKATPRPKPKTTQLARRKAPGTPAPAAPTPAAAARAPAPAQANAKEFRREARRQALFSSLHIHMEGAGRQALAGRAIADGAAARGAVDEDRGRWIRDVIRAIQRHLHRTNYQSPPPANVHNVFHIAFFPDGSVKSVTFLEHATFPGFDEDTQRAIEQAQPLPPPPNPKLLEEGADIRGTLTLEDQ